MSFASERALIAKLTEEKNVRLCWDRGLRAEVFEDPQCRMVFEFIMQYWLDNEMNLAPTARIIHTQFQSQDLTPSDESIRWLIEDLQKRFSTNNAQAIMLRAGSMANDDPQGALDLLAAEGWAARQIVSPRSNRMNMADSVAERRRRYAERQQNGARGVTFGFPEVDDVTNGLLPGELAAVAGVAKTGKSFFLCNAAVKARRLGYTPYIATMEQSVIEFGERADALWSGVSYQRLQEAKLHPEELMQLHEAQDELAATGGLHIEQPEMGQRTPQHLANRARQLGCDFLIVDQLSFMEARPGGPRFERVGDMHGAIIHDLKNEINRDDTGKLPCLLAVQFNRDAAKDTKGGGLHNFANTADIERAVDIAYGLSRTDEMRANNSMKLSILGNRRGEIGDWLLAWYLSERSELRVRERMERDIAA